jgi:4-amino-4-deoxy-L-arabinose transferase-like glycosyltransferase
MERVRSAVALWGLVLAAFLIPVLPRLVAHGMFMDGLWYGVIGRNLALGIGSFWRPMFTPTISPEFFSFHPPLAFGIESLFFRVLGDHWWVAGVYTLATAVATAGLILLLWREAERALGGAPSVRALGWLALLFWVATPLVTWSYSNNMLENTMGIFVLLAAWCGFRAAASPRWALWSAAAGACLYAALLSKGVVGLFPLAFPLILALAWGRPSPGRAALTTLIVLLVLAGLVAWTMQLPDVRLYAERYLGGNFLPLISGVRGGVPNRLNIVRKLLLELAPGIGLSLFVLGAGRWRLGAVAHARGRLAAAFVLLGLAGSLPLVLSPIQSGFYLVPSFALFALGFALFTGPSASAMLARVDQHVAWRRGLLAIAALLLAGAFAYAATSIGTIGRGGPVITDVRTIGAVVPSGSTVAICPSMYREWSLHGYFALYDHVTLDAKSMAHRYLVIEDDACPPPAGFVPVPLTTMRVRLYTR